VREESFFFEFFFVDFVVLKDVWSSLVWKSPSRGQAEIGLFCF